jgi:D-alanine transaminase
MLAWLNGDYADKEVPSICLEDRGLTFGDGLFEVCRVLEGKPLFFKEHLDRMVQSARFFNIPFPYGVEELYKVSRELIEKNRVVTGEVYFELTRGKDANREHRIRPQNLKPTFFILALPLREINPKNWESGAQVYLYPDKRHALCEHKTLNLFANVLAKNYANDLGGYEAMMYRNDSKGVYVTEGGSSTFFCYKEGVLFTPKIDNILPGVTRKKVLETARKIGVQTQEKRVYLREFLTAEEVFIASTVSKVMPVRAIEKRSWKTIGTITLSFMKQIEECIRIDIQRQG